MNQFKQNLWVISILFFSLMSSVALSYVITPSPDSEPIKLDHTLEIEPNTQNLNQSFTILLPMVDK